MVKPQKPFTQKGKGKTEDPEPIVGKNRQVVII